jgi:alkylation response protein AidB-like acyl-CoA dehydrogenase
MTGRVGADGSGHHQRSRPLLLGSCLQGGILHDIKVALDEGVDPGSAKYIALAERIRRLRYRIIQNAQEALAEALRIARAIVHIGVLSRIIRDHAPPGLAITEGTSEIQRMLIGRTVTGLDVR